MHAPLKQILVSDISIVQFIVHLSHTHCAQGSVCDVLVKVLV